MLSKIQKALLLGFVFIFPLFFLPFTQDFYQTNKFYLLAFVVLVTLLLSVVSFISTKKIRLKRHKLHMPLIVFLSALLLSVLFASPNKLAALVLPSSGLFVFIFLSIMSAYLTDKKLGEIALTLGFYSASALALLTLVFFANPLSRASLPQSLEFLKDQTFSTLGLQVDVAIFLGFFVVLGLARIAVHKNQDTEDADTSKTSKVSLNNPIQQLNQYLKRLKFWLPHIALTLLIVIAMTVSIYNHVFSQPNTDSTASTENQTKTEQTGKVHQLPPAMTSWGAAVEALRNPESALIGVGPDNYVSAFTRAKDPEYNSHDYWDLNFTRSRSSILHLWTVGGLLTFAAFGILLALMIRESLKGDRERVMLYFPLTLYMIAVLMLFPLSLSVAFLFFLTLAAVQSTVEEEDHALKLDANRDNREIKMITFVGVSLLMIGWSAFFLGKTYASEIHFKQGIDALRANNAAQTYTSQTRAIELAPFVERYHISFSQVNVLIANSLFKNVSEKTEEGGNVTDKDRTTITQAIQQAITEAKKAVDLNPEKSSNWENLASIYTNVIGIAQGAEQWTTSSYNQAIIADPANPMLRLAAGGVQYSLENYEGAIEFFLQAVRLKPDWGNAYYNLAWAYQKGGQNERAILFMEEALSRLEAGTPDYEQAIKDLEQFKEDAETTEPSEEEDSNLTLPKDVDGLDPQIELDEDEATPPAELRDGEGQGPADTEESSAEDGNNADDNSETDGSPTPTGSDEVTLGEEEEVDTELE